VGDRVKEMGREEGGDEVPVIDKGDGRDAAGTDRSDGAVLKFNGTKGRELKESNVV
jgi:hypothetical protein